MVTQSLYKKLGTKVQWRTIGQTIAGDWMQQVEQVGLVGRAWQWTKYQWLLVAGAVGGVTWWCGRCHSRLTSQIRLGMSGAVDNRRVVRTRRYDRKKIVWSYIGGTRAYVALKSIEGRYVTASKYIKLINLYTCIQIYGIVRTNYNCLHLSRSIRIK